ncbi:hypothetical protein TNCV_1955631 [Trichonephila clavipes]|nr:hypothetical protein TNCV_1955631 [Trichonephila clavipes]
MMGLGADYRQETAIPSELSGVDRRYGTHTVREPSCRIAVTMFLPPQSHANEHYRARINPVISLENLNHVIMTLVFTRSELISSLEKERNTFFGYRNVTNT